MANVTIIKDVGDINKLLGKIPGISGTVYDKLEGISTTGERKINTLEKSAEFSILSEIKEVYKEITSHGDTCAIEYDKSKNNFTIIRIPGKNKTVADYNQMQTQKGVISSATFDIVDDSGFNYGKNSNALFAFHDSKTAGGTGEGMILHKATAEMRFFRQNVRRMYEGKKSGKKGFLESASSSAHRRINKVYNDKSRDATQEFYDANMVNGIGQNYLIENAGKSKQIMAADFLKTAMFINKIDDYYSNLTWLMFARIAQAKDREEVILNLKKNPEFQKMFAKDPSKFDTLANEMRQMASKYNLEDIDWRWINENAAATGVLGHMSSATALGHSGNRSKATRDQSKQRVPNRVTANTVYQRSAWRSTAGEKRAGINRGQQLRVGDFVPADAVVMGIEVNPLDPRVANKYTLADNVGVSSELLKQSAGERGVTTRIGAKKAKEKLDRIVASMLKNKKEKEFIDKANGAQTFDALPPELQAIVLEEAWIRDQRGKRRDVRGRGQNSVQVEVDENGNYVIRGIEYRIGRQGNKMLGEEAGVKGSAEKMDDTLREFGSGYHFIVASKKGDIRKFGANYVNTDLTSLFSEYAVGSGLHNQLGVTKLNEYLKAVAKSGGDEAQAAQAILKAYSFKDGGVIQNRAIMDVINDIENPQNRDKALWNLLPLIDRLINGIDENNELMSEKNFQADKNIGNRYYTTTYDADGNPMLVRTDKAKRVFTNIHQANEYFWGGANLYAGRESLNRMAGLAFAQQGGKVSSANREGLKSLYDRIDVSEEDKGEFDVLKKNAIEAIQLTNKTTGGVVAGQQANGDYYVIIGGKGDPSDPLSSMDISQIAAREYDGADIINPDDILQGQMKKRLEELKTQGIDTSKVRFGINAGSFGGQIGNKTYGGEVLMIPTRMALDEEDGFFENYSGELQTLIDMINSSEDQKVVSEQAVNAMKTMLQDFQNKGSMYERYFGQKTKGVEAGKVLPMNFSWLRKAMGSNYDSLGVFDKWQADMATSGAFIDRDILEKSLKETKRKELLELYKKFYSGTEFITKDLKSMTDDNLRNAIETAVTYNEDEDSIFRKLLEAGNLDEGIKALVSRFPFSNGLDLKTIRKVFVDPNLRGSRALKLGFGVGNAFNADFDGDVAQMLLGTDFTKTENAVATVVAKAEEGTAKELAKFWYKDMVEDAGYALEKSGDYVKSGAGGISVLNANTMEDIFDQNIQLIAATGSRYTKQNTGKLSNLALEFREMLSQKGYDSANLLNDNTDEGRRKAANSLISSAFLEQMEQDAISSKKIIQRMIKLKTGWMDKQMNAASDDELYQAYYSAVQDIDNILQGFYSGKIELNGLMKGLSDIGVLNADMGMDPGRVLRQAFQKISAMKGGHKLISSILGTKESDLSFDEKDWQKENYYLNQKLSASQITQVMGKIATDLGINSADTMLAGLPRKNYTPEKRGIKTYDIATEDVKSANKEWLEHVNVLNKAEEAARAEATAESDKIVIAKKEAAAISELIATYETLSNKLEEAKDNYTAINRLSVTDVKNAKLPYNGPKNTGLDQEAYKNISERVRNGEVIKDEEYAEAFGVKDFQTAKSLMFGKLATLRGDYIHNIAQGNQSEADALREEIKELLATFKYDNKSINDSLATYEKAGKNIASITGKFGESLGSEIPIIGLDSAGNVINGRMDQVFYDKDVRSFTAVELKTHDKAEVTDADISQGLMYKTFLLNLKNYLKDKNVTDELAQNVIDDWVLASKNGIFLTPEQKIALTQSINKEYLGSLKEAKTVNVREVVASSLTGEAQAYAIGDKKDELAQAGIMLNGVLQPLDKIDRDAIKSASVKITANGYYKQGLVGTDKDTKGVELQAREASKFTDGQQNERFKEYLELLKEEYSILFEIAKLEKQNEVARAKTGIESDDISQKLKEQRAILKHIRSQKGAIADKKFSDSQQKTINDREAVEKLELTYNKKKLGYNGRTRRYDATTNDQIMAEKQYSSLLQENLRIEKEIEASKHTIAVSTSDKEKAALQSIIDLRRKDQGVVAQQLLQLQQSGLLRDEQLKQMTEEYQAELMLLQAREASKKGGAANLFDVVKNDIKRAALRMTDFSIVSKLLGQIPQKINQVVQYAKQLDVALMNLRVAGDLNVQQGKELILTYNNLANSLSSTTSEVAAAGDSWLRQGYTVQDTTELISASMKLSKLGQIDSATATKALTSALKGFKMEASEVLDVVDKLTKVDMEAAVSAGDISEGLSRVATSAQLAGLNMDQTIGMLSTIGEVTQRDLGSVGDSLRTLLSRYGNVKAGVFTQMGLDDDGETSDNINDIEKVLKQLGIRIRNSSLEMRDISAVLDELAQKWATLDTVTKNAVATAFAGVRQRENFLVMMENWDRVKELTEESADAAGTADKKYKAYTDSIEGATKRLQSAWEKVSQDIKTSDMIKDVTNFMAFLTEHLPYIVKMVTTMASVKFSKNITSFIGNTAIAGKGKLSLFKKGTLTYDENGNPLYTPGRDSGRTWNQPIQKVVNAITGAGGVKSSVDKIVDILTQKQTGINSAGPNQNTDEDGQPVGLWDRKQRKNQGLSREKRKNYQRRLDAGEQLSEKEIGKQIYKPGFTGATGEKVNGELVYYKNGYAFTSKGAVYQSGVVGKSTYTGPVYTGPNMGRDEQGRIRYLDDNNNFYTGENAYKGYLRRTYKEDKAQFEAYEAEKKAYDESLPTEAEIKQGQKDYKGAQTAQRFSDAGAAMASTLITEIATDNQIGDGVVTKLVGVNKTEQTVDESSTEKLGRAASSTLLAGIGGFLAGPVGGAIGQTVGEELADIISTGAHRDELERKQRSADAKESLGALETITSNTENIEKIVEDGVLTAEDYQSLTDSITKFSEAIQGFSDIDISNFMNGLASQLDLSSNESYAEILAAMQERLISGTTEERESLLSEIKKMTAQQEASQLFASQEQRRREISENNKLEIDSPTWLKLTNIIGSTVGGAIGGGSIGAALGSSATPIGTVIGAGAGTLIGGTTGFLTGWAINEGIDELFHDYAFNGSIEEQIEQAEALLKDIEEKRNDGWFVENGFETYSERVTEQLEDFITQREKDAIELANLDNEVYKKQAEAGLVASGLSDMTAAELGDYSSKGAINKVAAAMENLGYKVRDTSGAIKSTYLSVIKSVIASDTKLTGLINKDTKKIGEIVNAGEKLASVLKRNEGIYQQYIGSKDPYQVLLEMLEYVTPENANTFKGIANAIGISADELERLVYAANPDRIEQFANAWGITEEKAKELAKLYPNLTTESGQWSTSDATSNYSNIISYYEDIATNGFLSKDNRSKLIKENPELIDKMQEGSDALMEYLASSLGDDRIYTYLHSLFQEQMTSEAFGDDFLKEYGDTEITDEDGNKTTLKKMIGDAKTLDDFLNKARAAGGDVETQIGELISKYMDFEQIIEFDDPEVKAATNAYLKTLDKQISALEEQKSALDELNESREFELSLIKAREALENAKKEKKRVYRAGVGWTYEADSEAVSKAQEDLENANIDIQKENLETQIEALKTQQEILSNIEDNEQLKAAQKSLESLLKSSEGFKGDTTAILAAMAGRNKIKYNASTGKATIVGEDGNVLYETSDLPSYMNNQHERLNESGNKIDSLWAEVVKAREALETDYTDDEGNALKFKEGYDEAANKYQKAIQAYDDNAKTYVGLGGTLSDDNEKNRNGERENVKKYTPTEVIVPDLDELEKAGIDLSKFKNKGISKEMKDALTRAYQEASGGKKPTEGAIIYFNDGTEIPTDAEYNYVYGVVDGEWRRTFDGKEKTQTLADTIVSLEKNGGYAAEKTDDDTKKNATGTYSFNGGSTLINELGTEGIITPSGTLTALPSKTGIVPADITRNVWQLGEVAPTLIAQLKSITSGGRFTNVPQSVVNENGQYVDSLTMNIYPTKDYDMDALLAEARAKARLTRHNN